MTIIENSKKLVIPGTFRKSGYQGYKIFLDRYTLKKSKDSFDVDDLCLVITEPHPKLPKKEIGIIERIDGNDISVFVFEDDSLIEVDVNYVSVPLEEVEDVKVRVARELASCEPARDFWAGRFEDVLIDKFIPGGRILAGAGAGELTLNNCYVIPNPKDSRHGVFESVAIMAETHSRGGGVGVNISSLRPRYAHVEGVNGTSSGSVSWANLYNVSTGLIEQGGSRRGATMLMIWDWHPDVIEFIKAKETPGEFENTNMSVCISDTFMEAVIADADWHLVFPDTTDSEYDEIWNGDLSDWIAAGKAVKTYKTIKARELWGMIIEHAWENAEPGVHFLERSNKMSNAWYFETLVATNPCGEQPLEPFGVCTLGAIDLSKFVRYDPVMDRDDVNWMELSSTIHTAVRFLDNVIDVNQYHSPEIEKAHKNNRRIGLGHMGIGELLVRLKIRYGSEECIEFLDRLGGFFMREAYLASSQLAAEKGSFPAFDAELYLKSGFAQNLPQTVKNSIRKNGMRNVCVLTQAPNGTTGTMMGTSTGIEPFYAWLLTRKSRLGLHHETPFVIDDLGLDINNLPDYCVTAQDLSPEEHLNVQATLQKYVDSAISKTTNVPAEFTVEQTDLLYRRAWEMGCKGITIYRDGSRHEQVLTVVKNVQTQDNNCEVCGEILINTDGCVSCPNGCFSACQLY